MKKIIPILLFIMSMSMSGQYAHDVYNNYHTDNYHQWIGVSPKRLDQGMTYIVDVNALLWRYVFAQWQSDTLAADSIVDIINPIWGTSYDFNDIPFFPNSYTYYENVLDSAIEAVTDSVVINEGLVDQDSLDYYYLKTVVDDSLSDVRDDFNSTIGYGITAADTTYWGTNTYNAVLSGVDAADTTRWGATGGNPVLSDVDANDTTRWGTGGGNSVLASVTAADTTRWGLVDLVGVTDKQILYNNNGALGTDSKFLFTEGTRSTGFYDGTATPTGTDTMKWNGRFFARDLTAATNFYNPGTSTINTLAVSGDATVNGHTRLGNASADSTYVTGDLYADGEVTIRDTTIIDLIEEHAVDINNIDLSNQADNGVLLEDADTIYSTTNFVYDDTLYLNSALTIINPKVAASGSSIAYKLDTKNTLSGLDELLTVRNNGIDRFVADAGGYGYFNNSLNVYANSFGSATDYGVYAAKSITLRSNNTNWMVLTPSTTGSTRFSFRSENYLNGDYLSVFTNKEDTVATIDSITVDIRKDFTVDGKTTLGDASSDTTIVTGWFKNEAPHTNVGFTDSSVVITGGDSVQITNAGDSLFRYVELNGFSWGDGDTILADFKGGWYVSVSISATVTANSTWKVELAYKRNGTTYYDELRDLVMKSTASITALVGFEEFYFESEPNDKVWLIVTRTAGSGDFTITAGSWNFKGYITQ